MSRVKFPTQRPNWLINEERNRLELDGYNEELKIAFEYQGEQHFSPLHNNFFGGKEALAKRQNHDNIKKELCEKNEVFLLCPDYKMKNKKDFREYILNKLKNTKYEKNINI